MPKEYSKQAQIVLAEVSNFTEGRAPGTMAQDVHLQRYETLINVYPFKSGTLRAKVANRLMVIPLKAIKNAFQGYFAQKDYMSWQLIERFESLESQINTMQQSENLSSVFDRKIYEIAKLNDRLKSELMAEINKDQSPIGATEQIETKIINEAKYKTVKRLNLGSGSFLKPDYMNIDHREIEGVDMVADIGRLPYKPDSVEEIYSSHVAEHFTEPKFKDLLNYWYDLLKKGGKLVIIVPNIEAMVRQYVRGDITWDNLRQVVLGGQDYNSDYHFNTFSTDYMQRVIKETIPEGKYKLVADARPNGECLEMEVTVTK